jgi:Ni,Fe-hydrogenase I small subunit
MASVLWLQGGACSGNTMSFLNADEPNVVDLIVDFGLEVIWHPSLGLELGNQAQKIFSDCATGARPMDVFVFEGSVIEAPNGTGRMDMFADRPMKEWVTELASQAGIVVAIGDCACWGGIPAMEPNPSGSTGLQFHKRAKGGFLGPNFTSKAGLPVINIPGCPAHPDWITQILVALATGRTSDISLDDLQRPETFFKTFTQTGCTRVQFYEFGCRGPMTHSPCNRILWNRQSSKTRAGQPCYGCTEPEFPHFDLAPGTLFKTQKVAGVIPKETGTGTKKLSYMAAAAAARVAAPQWSKEDMFVV